MLKHKRRLRFMAAGCLLVFLAGFTTNRSRLDARSPAAFPVQLDHVFVWVTKGAPEAKVLEAAGLQIQDHTNQHTGQGTASKTFIFENLYLELIWIDDEEAAARNSARSGIDMATRSRWQTTGASPFGVGLHRRPASVSPIPFPVTHYWAEWMKPDTLIEFAQSVSNNSEPMYFVVPDYISTGNPAMQTMLMERFQNSRHRLGVSRLSNLKIVTTGKKLTPTSEVLTRGGIMKVERGKAPLVELSFDGGTQKKRVDLRPQLPIVLKY